jgi:hypothetical protein
MKNLFKVFIVLMLFCLYSCPSMAQTNQALYLRNSNNNLFRYGYQAILTTTNNTPATMLTFAVATDEAGFIEAQVVGFDSTNGLAITGALQIRYKKSAGTLTLGSPVTDATLVVDDSLHSATFAFSASSNNILLRVTGDTGKTVKWIANIRWINKKS